VTVSYVCFFFIACQLGEVLYTRSQKVKGRDRDQNFGLEISLKLLSFLRLTSHICSGINLHDLWAHTSMLFCPEHTLY